MGKDVLHNIRVESWWVHFFLAQGGQEENMSVSWLMKWKCLPSEEGAFSLGKWTFTYLSEWLGQSELFLQWLLKLVWIANATLPATEVVLQGISRSHPGWVSGRVPSQSPGLDGPSWLDPQDWEEGWGYSLSHLLSHSFWTWGIIEDVNVLWADYPRRDFGESQNIFWTPELLIIAGFALGFSKNHTIVKSKPSAEMGPKAQTALSSQSSPQCCGWNR